MPTRIDHVIAAADDFPALEATFSHLGFHVTGGGTHPHLGTRNRIIVLGDGYIELLGIADAARVSPVISRRLAGGVAGWVGFALQAADIASEAETMRARGVDAHGPYPGRLVAPNGMTRSWRLVLRGTDDTWAAAEPVPFLIQHDSAGENHQRELAGEGTLASHPNGALRLGAVMIAISSLAEAQQELAQTYALQTQGAPRSEEALGAEVISLPLPADGEAIELAVPNGPGIARQRIERAGDGVCAVLVAVASLAETEAFLRERAIGLTFSHDTLWIAPADILGIPLCFVKAQI